MNIFKLLKPDKPITIICFCGTEWDFKSPITLLECRRMMPVTSVSTFTVGLGAKDAKKAAKKAKQ